MIRDFFYMPKSDRKVILTLLVLMVLIMGSIWLTADMNDTSNALVSADSIDISATRKYHRDSSRRQPYRERTVYVRTKVIYRDTAYQRGRRLADVDYDSIKAHYQPKIRQGEHIVLNTADTTQLKMVPGIGPYFASKIVQYGQRLGGYVSVDQLDEIDNFPLDAKDYLTIDHPSPVRLNINRLSLNELKRHPYINFYQARAIVDYRRQNGIITDIGDLRLLPDFGDEAISRLRPYVTY